MVIRGEMDFDVEGCHDLFVEVAHKGIAVVRDGRLANSKP